MPSKEFKESLAIGREYEQEVLEWASILFDRKLRIVDKEKDEEWYRYFDIVEDLGRKKLDLSDAITIECKYSKQVDSPNIVIEFSTYDEKPSCISTSLAKYFVFNIGLKFHLIVERADLIRAIIKDLIHGDNWSRITHTQFDKKRILIVPISYLLSECKTAQKHVRIGRLDAEKRKDDGPANTPK